MIVRINLSLWPFFLGGWVDGEQPTTSYRTPLDLNSKAVFVANNAFGCCLLWGIFADLATWQGVKISLLCHRTHAPRVLPHVFCYLNWQRLVPVSKRVIHLYDSERKALWTVTSSLYLNVTEPKITPFLQNLQFKTIVFPLPRCHSDKLTYIGHTQPPSAAIICFSGSPS